MPADKLARKKFVVVVFSLVFSLCVVLFLDKLKKRNWVLRQSGWLALYMSIVPAISLLNTLEILEINGVRCSSYSKPSKKSYSPSGEITSWSSSHTNVRKYSKE